MNPLFAGIQIKYATYVKSKWESLSSDGNTENYVYVSGGEVPVQVNLESNDIEIKGWQVRFRAGIKF